METKKSSFLTRKIDDLKVMKRVLEERVNHKSCPVSCNQVNDRSNPLYKILSKKSSITSKQNGLSDLQRAYDQCIDVVLDGMKDKLREFLTGPDDIDTSGNTTSETKQKEQYKSYGLLLSACKIRDKKETAVDKVKKKVLTDMMGKYSLSPTSQDTVHEYVLKAVKLTQTMLTLLPPTVVVIPQSYDDLLQDTNRATWNEKKVGPHVKITHYRPVLLYGNHAHVAVKGLVGNDKLRNEGTSCNTSLPTTSATASKVEGAEPQTKSDILVTSHKPLSPISALPVTAQASIKQSKQETPHCSTFSADFHGKQTPTHYSISRTLPTNRELVNKTHPSKTRTSKVEDPKRHTKSDALVTSHKPPSPIHALPDTTQTSNRQSKQETPHCSTYSADFHGKQVPTHTISRTFPTNRELVNKTQPPKTHTSKVEDPKRRTKSDALVTSHKPPSPIHALPDTTQTSKNRQSKQETPHCSMYSADFHGKQVPTHTISRTSPTNRDLVNKTSQSLSLPYPPISNNLVPSVTSQLSCQVTNVISSNKSQQVHESCPLTTNSPISSLQVSQNDDSVLHHTNTSITSIPLPSSKHPDVDSVRKRCYRISLSQSPPSPHKKSPMMKEVLSPTQADSIIPNTPVSKESPSPRMPALYKEILPNPQAQKHTNSKTISPEIKPFLTTDYPRKATNTSSSITHATQSISPKYVPSTSRSSNKKTKISVCPAVYQEILPSMPHVNLHSSTRQNQKTPPTRQRQSQSQRQRINQQQSVINNPSQRHPMILRSKKNMPASSPNSKERVHQSSHGEYRSKCPDFSESGRTKHYKKSSSQSPPSPHKKSPMTKEVLSPTQADSIILSTPIIKESPSPRIHALYKEILSNPQAQKHTN